MKLQTVRTAALALAAADAAVVKRLMLQAYRNKAPERSVRG